MSPLVYVLLGSFSLSALLAMAWVGAMDRADVEARRRDGRLPTITSLPRASAIPAATRKKWGRL